MSQSAGSHPESLAALTKRLRGFARPGGGFSYYPGNPPAAEPTILAILAFLAAQEESPDRAETLQWLGQCRQPDGAVSCFPGVPGEGVWITPLEAILHHHVGDMPSRDRALAFLLNFRPVVSKEVASSPVMLDGSLAGWPWVPGTYSWVEPTSWALLALTLGGSVDHPRCQEGRKLLMDRQIPSGGWNYGNKVVYDTPLLPFLDTSGLALMALRAQVPIDLVAGALAFLRQGLEETESPYAMTMAVLGVAAWETVPAGALQKLADLWGGFSAEATNAAHLALGIIALSGERILTA